MLVMSVGCGLAALGLSWGSPAPNTELLRGVLLKVGIIVFMWWLALPQLRRLNWWLLAPAAVVSLVGVVRPQFVLLVARSALPLAPVLVPIIIVLYLLRKPRNTRNRRA